VGQIIVGMADCRIAQVSGDMLTTFALGSCIGLAVHDRKAAVGGLLHFMLPDSSIDSERARVNPYMFADTGIPLLLQQVFAKGATRRNLVVHAAGGAEMMDQGHIFEIGKRNYLAARKLLWKSGLLLSGEAVGGMNCRTLRLEVGSGLVTLHEAGSARGVPVPAAKGETRWPTAF
jgi:chemotaxis protein CheD